MRVLQQTLSITCSGRFESAAQNVSAARVGPIIFVDDYPVPQSAMMRYDITDKGNGNQPAAQVFLIVQAEFISAGYKWGRHSFRPGK